MRFIPVRCATARESPVSVASPVGADWPITRQKGPHTLIQQDSLWQVEPGAAFAQGKKSSKTIHISAWKCSMWQHCFHIRNNYPAEGSSPEEVT